MRFLLLCSLPLLTGHLAGQACPGGVPRTGTLGIGMFVCVTPGEGCLVNRRVSTGFVHQFSVEPAVRDLVPGGPAARQLQEGDMLVAIDDAFITTAEGGRRLAQLEAGRPIRLRIRRAPGGNPAQGRELEVTLTPEPGCNTPGLAVVVPGRSGGWSIRPGDPASSLPPRTDHEQRLARGLARATPPLEFGFDLACEECGWVTGGSGMRLRFTSPPEVRSVAADGPADRAGLQPGDVLLEVEGVPIDSDRAAELLGRARPNVPLRFLVRKADRVRTVTLVPQGPARSF